MRKGQKRTGDLRRESTAYHEAGHVVSCYKLNFRPRMATIHPDPDSGTLGHVKVPGQGKSYEAASMGGGMTLQQYQKAENELVHLLAGLEAEMKFREDNGLRRNYAGSRLDYDKATHRALYLCGEDAKEASLYLTLLQYRARKIVRRHWPQVELIARELLVHETLTGREIRSILSPNVAIKILQASE